MSDLISRAAAIDELCKRCDLVADEDVPCTEKCNDIKILEMLPSVQPTQSNVSNTLNALDCISRQAAIDAHCVLCPDKGRVNCDICPDVEVFQLLPSAQPDLEEYSVWFRIGETLVDVSKMHITADEGIAKIRSYLMRMKKPERKKGKWILKDLKWECDKCGCRIRRAKPFSGNIWNYYYCPNCGADMRGEQDDSISD